MSSGFRITEPNGNNITLLYDKNTDKVELLNKLLLNKWRDYCNENFENEKVINFLNRCGTFLLLGNFKNGNILSYEMVKVIKNNEKIESQCSESVKNLIGGTSNNEDNFTKERTFYDPYVGVLYGKQKYKYVNKTSKKKTKINKIRRIYNVEERKTYEIKVGSISKTFKSSYIVCEDKIIKGHKGIIDKDKDYISEWCSVDTDGIFKFDGDFYKIPNELVQYQVKTKKGRKRNEVIDYYEMDKILGFKQDNKVYFYDMNIDKIIDSAIKKI